MKPDSSTERENNNLPFTLHDNLPPWHNDGLASTDVEEVQPSHTEIVRWNSESSQ